MINGHKILTGKPEMKRPLWSHDPLWKGIYYKIRPEKVYIPQTKMIGFVLQRQKCDRYFTQI